MIKIDTQKFNIINLLELIKENPELKIVPKVYTDVVPSDDWAWWIAGWGSASIEEIYTSSDRVYIRSKDEDDLREDKFDQLELNNPSWSDEYLEEQSEKELSKIKWEKVITVSITLP